MDVVKTFDIDATSTTARAMLKITRRHLSPNNFQKMRVKYAAQTFSHSVAAAIKTSLQIGQLRSTTALQTAEFIYKINDIFDALNSRSLQDPNPNRRPLSIYQNRSVDVLVEAVNYFENVAVFENNKKRNNIYCIDGFKWTIKSVLMLWEHLKKKEVKYLLTGFLNQDPLENFFSVIRNRGGYNPSPTVRQCRIAIQHNVNIRLQTALGTGNCELDECDFLELEEKPVEEHPVQTEEESYEQQHQQQQTPYVYSQSGSSNENANTHPLIINPANINTLETCSITYVAGYLAFMVQKSFLVKTVVQNLHYKKQVN